jgi:hypothetical protein
MLPGTKEANERVRKFQQGGIPLLMSQGTGSEVKSLSPEYKLRMARDGKAAADEWWEEHLKKTGRTEFRPKLPETQEEWWARQRAKPYPVGDRAKYDENEWLKIKQMVLIHDYTNNPKTPKYIRDNINDYAWYEAERQAKAFSKGEKLVPIDVDPQGNFKKWMLTSSMGTASRRRSSGLSYQEFKAQEKKRVEEDAARKITAAVRKVAKKKSKEPRVRTNVGMEEMIKLRDDAIVAKRARLTGETKAEARKALVAMKAIYVPEPEPEPELDVAEWTLKNPVRVYYVEEARAGLSFEKRRVIDPKTEDVIGELGEAKFADLRELIRRKDDLDDEFPDLEELDMPEPQPQSQSHSKECPKHPRKHASSVRQTKMAMRGPNPNREGWKLPRKPYGHANEVVELEDDLTDAEMKKMTSELPRRCLVEAVADWAKENNKIVLPSITRADKAEIVATIKEHRIPVPKMSGGGYYGDDMDNILTGGQIHNEVHLCPECRMGDDEWDWIENERRTTQPYEIAGGADPNPDDRKRGRDVPEESEEESEEEEEEDSMEDASEESEDDFARDIAFVCAECGQDVMWGSPEYAGRRDTEQGPVCADCAALLGAEDEEEEEEDDDDMLAPPPPPAPAPEGFYEGGSKNLPPFFHMRGFGEYDWGGDEDVYYDEDGKETTKDKYEKEFSDGSEDDLPEQPQFIGDPSQFKVMPFDPNNPMMYRGSGLFDYSYSGAKESTDRMIADMAEAKSKKEEKERRRKKKQEETGWMPIDFDAPIEFDSDGDYEGRDWLLGRGGEKDYLKKAKAFAKKAGYADWKNLKYATDGVHKLELNGVKFGRKGYGDFIDYGMKDGAKEAQKHRSAYLARATKIKGDWKDDPMSKNNLAIKVLWGGSPFHHLRGGAKQPALPPNIDLVSKKESPIVEEIIEEPMDDTDIRAYYPNAKIMRYSDLKNYKTITQLLPKDKSYAFLLYQQETNSGHWVLIMRYGSTIEFFCSYGSAIDAPLKWTNPRDRQLLGEAVPYLSNLLKSQKEFNVIHNPVQYQSKGSDKATCGAHDVMRLSQMLNHGQDLTDYYDFMSRVKKESGLSYDEIVANFVSQR